MKDVNITLIPHLTALLLAFAVSACGVDDTLTLRESVPNSHESEGMQYVRSLQLLKYFVNGDPSEQSLESTSCSIASALMQLCVPEAAAHLTAAIRTKCNVPCANEEALPPGEKRACSELTCQVEKVTCTANALLDLASTLSPISYTIDEDTELVVPAQSFPVQARLRELAFENVATGALMLSTWMGASIFENVMLDFPNSELDCGMPRGEGLVTWMEAMKTGGLELIQLAHEAALRASSDYVALADGLRGRHPMQSLSSRENREIRAHAAHLLGGGGDLRALLASDLGEDPELVLGDRYDFTTYDLPICTTRPLERGARDAASIIRESGIHPAYVLALDPSSPSYLSIEDLIAGNGGENVKNRIAAYRDIDDVLNSYSAVQFAEYFGLTISDFLLARESIAEEYHIFRRSLSTTTDDLLPATYAGDRFRYAATVNSPTTPHWARYASEYSHIGVDKFYDYEGSGEDNLLTLISLGAFGPQSAQSFNTSILNVTSQWASIGERSAPEGSFERDLYRLALDYRRHLFPDGIAKVLLHYDPLQEASFYEVVVSVRTSGHAYGIVTSDEALECAIQGRVEGVSCRSEDFDITLGTQPLPIDLQLEQLGFFPEEETEYTPKYFGMHELTETRPIYLLRTKDPLGNAVGPGAWDVLGVGNALPLEIPGAQLAMPMHLDPVSFQRMGAIMTPSTKWCAQPSVHCGEDFDARIPLEDELTGDGTAYENSWRRYLSLAREAADFADSLGQQARDAVMSMDELAQGALTELQELCGSFVSLDAFQSCTDCEGGLTPEEVLAQNLVEGNAPDLMRLERCVGATGKIAFATLGDEPLCAWTIGDDTTTLCSLLPGDSTNLACPRFVSTSDGNDADASGCRPPNDNPAYQPLLIGADPKELLRIFSRPDLYVEPPPRMSCNVIRTMREKFINREPFFVETLNTFFAGGKPYPLWLPSNLESLVSSIRWTAKPGNFSTVFVGSNALATTGDFMVGSAQTGVCASSELYRTRYQCDGQVYESSLFCADRSCANENMRQIVNGRLSRAAMLARLFPLKNEPHPFTNLAGFTVPMQRTLLPHDAVLEERVVTINHGIIGETVDIYQGQRDEPPDEDGALAPVRYYAYPDGSRAYYSNSVVGFTDSQVTLARERNVPRDATLLPFLANFIELALPFSLMGVDGKSLRATSPIIYPEGANALGILDLLTNNGYDRTSSAMSLTSIGTFFDALELVCEASQAGAQPHFECGAPAPFEHRDQIYHAADQLACLANNINGFASRFVFHGLPDNALDAMRSISTVGALPADGGDYAQAISRIRQRLIAVGQLPRDIAANIDGLARDVRRIAIEFERSDIQQALHTNSLLSSVSAHMTQCSTTALSVSDSSLWGIAGKVAAAAITCHNAIFQVALALDAHRLQELLLSADGKQLLIDVEESLRRRMEALESLAAQLTHEAEALDAELSNLESIRLRARRALYRGLFMDDPDVKKAFSIEGSQRQRLNTVRVRYEHARRDAIRMSFLAKRAIEQRFGVELATIRSPMTLVEAPSSWEGRVCMMSGINSAGGGRSEGSDGRDSSPHYAEEFLGDWVSKLERFVDSYRIDHPFSDGSDTAVVSVRDDIIGTRAWCEVWTGNLFSYSDQLSTRGASANGTWGPENCTEGPNGDAEPNCVSVRALDADEDGGIDTSSAYGDPTPYTIHFGPPLLDCSGDVTNDCPCSDEWCGFNEDVIYGQRMWLDSGRYQLSYYARGSDAAMQVRRAEDQLALPLTNSHSAEKRNGFTRFWHKVHVPDAGEYIVGFVPPGGEWDSVVEVAGASLVELSPMATDLAREPAPFAATDSNGMRKVPLCEDTDGSHFRREGWTYRCVDLCSYGFSDACAASSSTERCFWETEFYVSQRDIDRGNVFAASGFARGNFNYRLDTIGLNFVGSAARVCSNPLLPSTCYNAGWIPFSLEHRGPYTVLNNFGEHYDAKLFTGRIEQGRGLAAERYLSNPISSADQALISQYTTTQLRGRPLTGWYVLRVWDEPGVNFEGIEDVQVVLNYRFWTRNH